MRTDGIVFADAELFKDLRSDPALGQVADVAALQERGVEGDEGDAVGLAVLDRLLDEGEAADAVLVEDDGLAVDDRTGGYPPGEHRAQAAEMDGLVVPCPELDAVVDAPGEDAPPVPLDLVHPVVADGHPVHAGAEHGGERLGEFDKGAGDVHRQPGLGDGGRGAHLHPQPLVTVGLRPDEDEVALQALAVDGELQLALGELGVGVLVDRLPGALVPQDDLARAVVALGNLAGEGGVVDGVVLDTDGEAADAFALGRPLGHRPTEEDALVL